MVSLVTMVFYSELRRLTSWCLFSCETLIKHKKFITYQLILDKEQIKLNMRLNNKVVYMTNRMWNLTLVYKLDVSAWIENNIKWVNINISGIKVLGKNGNLAKGGNTKMEETEEVFLRVVDGGD